MLGCSELVAVLLNVKFMLRVIYCIAVTHTSFEILRTACLQNDTEIEVGS